MTETTERGPGIWMFNASLINDKQYVSLVESFWASCLKTKNNFKTTSEWWDLTKKRVKDLTIEYTRSKRKHKINIGKLEEELVSLKSLSRTENVDTKMGSIECQIKDFYEQNRNAFIVRSKVNDLLENETSSKYFFNLEKQRSKA